MKKVDILQQDLEQLQDVDVLISGLPFVQAFRAFSRVVDSCFGIELKEGFEQHIEEFKRIYLGLGISVTPKVG